jgi:hypothetical protein
MRGRKANLISAKVKCVCEICGREIGWYYPSLTRRVCSTLCQSELARRTQSGQNNQNYRHGKYCSNFCELCGVKIDPRAKRCVQCKKHGSKYKTKGGYILIRNRKHPNRNHNNDVLEHIMVMSDSIGRPINKGEVVHHVNFIKNDNRIENLYLFNNIGEHGRCSKGIFKLIATLLDSGIIEFKDGEYIMKEGSRLIGGVQ